MLFALFNIAVAKEEDDCAVEDVEFSFSQILSPEVNTKNRNEFISVEFWLRYLLETYSENPYLQHIFRLKNK
eukprot:UN25217